MDFGENGRIDGFDAWRLSLFAEGFCSASRAASVEEIQIALNSLVEGSEIEKSQSPIASHLYFPVQ